MEQRQKARSEIEEKYKWDLTPIYKDVDSWYEDYEKFLGKQSGYYCKKC